MLVAKKTAISITIDSDILRALDDLLRSIQEKELKGRKRPSNRSRLIERIIADHLGRESANHQE